MNYFSRIAKTHYFWTHLVFSDLRAKYRRSFLGIAWALLHPLSLTLLLGFVMSRVFDTPFQGYAPYILSGLIIWEFITTSAVTGCHAFINAESYIRQVSHPLAIYSLRSSLTCFANLCVAMLGLFAYVLAWAPSHFNLCALSLLLAFPLLFSIGWALATITAYIATCFRDFSQMIVILLQALWYISPVFFLPSVFEGGKIRFLLDYNPVYHLLCLFRAPLLYGELPTPTNYLFAIGTTVALGTLAAALGKTTEKKVIFYL